MEGIHSWVARQAFGRNCIPSFVKDSIYYHKTNSFQQVKADLQKTTAELLRIRENTKPLEEDFRANQPAAVKEVQSHFNHEFCLEVFRRANSPDLTHPNSSFKDIFSNGQPVVGPVPRSYDLPMEEPRIPLKKDPFEKETFQVRKKPPSWLDSETQHRLWREYIGSEDFKSENELSAEELVTPPVYVFAALQGEVNESTGFYEKCRRILDWRLGNSFSPAYEKIVLFSHSCLFSMITLMLSYTAVICPVVQMTKDVNFDVNLMRDEKCQVHETPPGRCLMPHFAKLDFRRYYFQFAVNNPIINSIAIWDPTSTPPRYRFFYSGCSQFGNIHSIFWAVRFSYAIMRVINSLCNIPAILYIDDTILIMCLETLQCARAVVLVLYSCMGILMSNNKDECMDANITKSLKILGLMYRISGDTVLVSPPEIKLKLTINLASEIKQRTLNNNLCPDVFEKLCGLCIFLLYNQNSRKGFHYIKQLYNWSIIKFFWANIKRVKSKIYLVWVLDRVIEMLEMPISLKFSESRVNAPVKYLYTDASLENNAVRIGGTLAEPCGPPFKAFSVGLLKDWASRLCHGFRVANPEQIAVYELLGVFMALVVFDSAMIGSKWVLLCDNIVACYGMVKGASNGSLLISALINIILKRLEGVDSFYVVYLKSKLNIADPLTRLVKLHLIESFCEIDIDHVSLQPAEKELTDELSRLQGELKDIEDMFRAKEKVVVKQVQVILARK